MGQNNGATLIYALVARGTPPVVLVEYSGLSGNFNSIAYQCLHKLPSSNNKFTYNCDNHTFNYFVHDAFTYCVVATESAGRHVPLAFLDRIKDDFEMRPKLKELMQYCIEHPEEICKLEKVKAQVKGVMMANIDKVVDRGEKIELSVDKTEDLHQQAQDFHSGGSKMRLQNTMIKLIVLAIVIALILVIVFSACKGFDCGK